MAAVAAATMRDGRAAPRWAHVTAHIIPLTALPSGLWRIAIALGFSLGMLEDGEPIHMGGWESVYLVCLSVVVEGLALLAFGLVKPWGERVPQRVPRVGGRRIPPAAVIATASVGAAITTVVGVLFNLPSDGMSQLEATDAGLAVAMACYAPLLLWGPLLAALTVGYHRRRCRD